MNKMTTMMEMKGKNKAINKKKENRKMKNISKKGIKREMEIVRNNSSRIDITNDKTRKK